MLLFSNTTFVINSYENSNYFFKLKVFEKYLKRKFALKTKY